MHSQNGNSSRGDERHWIPLAKMMGGMHPPHPPTAVDAPGGFAGEHVGYVVRFRHLVLRQQKYNMR